MKVGIFTDTYYPNVNGVVTSIQVLEKELRVLGHEVYIFTSANKAVKEKSKNVFRFPSVPIVFYKPYRMSIWFSPRMIYKIKKLKLDVIHTQTEFSMGIFGKIMAKMFKIPMVHTYHTMYDKYVHYVANGHLISPKMAQRLSRIFCNRADLIIAPTKKTEDSLKSYGIKKPTVVIPTGIDLEQFKKEVSNDRIQTLKNKYKIGKDDYVVLYLGRIAKEKNIDVLINQMPYIIEKVQQAKLLIVGGGPYLQELKDLVGTLKISEKVIFTGEISHSEINEYYKLGNVFVISSNTETQGLTYLEAMSAGLPVVVRNDESYKDFIVNGENGYIFDEPEEISHIIYRLCNDKDLDKIIIENANKSIENLSSKKFAENVIKAYETAIENKKK